MRPKSAPPKTAQRTEYPPTPMAYFRTKLPKNNILIGTDPAQIRFLVQQLFPKPDPDPAQGDPVERVAQVEDDMVLGQTGKLYQIDTEQRLLIADDTRAYTGIWDASPITAGSAGANAIVRHAWTLVGKGEKLAVERQRSCASEIARERVEDIRSAVWQAAWILTGDQKPFVPWPEPWQSPVGFLPVGTNPFKRLDKLYRVLVGWTFLRTGCEQAVAQLQLHYRQQEQIKGWQLDPAKVAASIRVLSTGRYSDPEATALSIAAIWAP